MNGIGNKGAKYLSRLKAPVLIEINFCMNAIRQLVTTSVKKE